MYGFYAEATRVCATIPATTEKMRAAAKTYDIVTYEGAGHSSCAGDAGCIAGEQESA